MTQKPLDALTSAVTLLELATATLYNSRHCQVNWIKQHCERNAEKALADLDALFQSLPDWRWYFTLAEDRPVRYPAETLTSYLRRIARWYRQGIERARRTTAEQRAA